MPPEIRDAPWLTAASSRKLMDVLTAGNAPARFIGGCVRDALLGHHAPDVDLDVATVLQPEQVIQRLEAAGIKVIPTGVAHGTVTAIVDGRPFEITTLRKDVACDGRHADVQFTDDFRLDAERRDFTINTLAIDRHGELVDYVGGVDDLRSGRIRFVGEASERVREDYLRILRFFRFYARFGRPPPDQQALEACRQGAPGLARLSGERIRSEMLKLLAASNAVAALALMIDHKVLCHVLPVPVDPAALARLIAAAPDSDPLLRLAGLLRSSPERSAGLAAVSAWRLSKAESTRIERLLDEPAITLPASAKESRRHAYRLGRATYLDLLKLSANDPASLAAALPVPEIPPFPLNGQDLIDRGITPGPDLGALLAELERWWLQRDMQPDRTALLQRLDQRLKPADSPRNP